MFPDEKEVTLEAGSLSFMETFVREIPELVLENRDAKQERLEEDRRKDEAEKQCNDQNDDMSKNDDESATELMAKINKLFRATEVCGQILRNRLGSLERDSLELIYEESVSVSLRFLGIFLELSEFVKEESIRRIGKAIDQHPDYSNSKIIQEIKDFYMGMNYSVILGMLHRTSFSLGSAKGRDIYTKVAEKKNTPALHLIQEMIELQFEKKIDFNKIEKLHTEFSKNYTCDRLLKTIILRHCYRHDIGYKDRQRLANKLNISMRAQRLTAMTFKRIQE